MAITPTQWARIFAKAWYESTQGKPDFQEKLERDPANAIDDAVRKQFGISRVAKIIDLDYDYDPVAQQLRDSATPDLLLQVIKDGELNGNQMSGGTWIRPNPQEEITLPESAVNQAMSLADWTRIYAYIWHRYLVDRDVQTRARFEKDPASIVPEIVADIEKKYPGAIGYKKGNRLLDLGLPPHKDKEPTVLKSIEDDGDAKQYRHIPKWC